MGALLTLDSLEVSFLLYALALDDLLKYELVAHDLGLADYFANNLERLEAVDIVFGIYFTFIDVAINVKVVLDCLDTRKIVQVCLLLLLSYVLLALVWIRA